MNRNDFIKLQILSVFGLVPGFFPLAASSQYGVKSAFFLYAVYIIMQHFLFVALIALYYGFFSSVPYSHISPGLGFGIAFYAIALFIVLASNIIVFIILSIVSRAKNKDGSKLPITPLPMIKIFSYNFVMLLPPMAFFIFAALTA
jgi:hypothetical protein